MTDLSAVHPPDGPTAATGQLLTTGSSKGMVLAASPLQGQLQYPPPAPPSLNSSMGGSHAAMGGAAGGGGGALHTSSLTTSALASLHLQHQQLDRIGSMPNPHHPVLAALPAGAYSRVASMQQVVRVGAWVEKVHSSNFKMSASWTQI